MSNGFRGILFWDKPIYCRPLNIAWRKSRQSPGFQGPNKSSPEYVQLQIAKSLANSVPNSAFPQKVTILFRGFMNRLYINHQDILRWKILGEIKSPMENQRRFRCRASLGHSSTTAWPHGREWTWQKNHETGTWKKKTTVKSIVTIKHI